MSDETYRVITPDFIRASICTDSAKINSTMARKFQKDLTVWDLKQRLELITGRNANTMTVTALTADGELVCKLDDNFRALGSYPLSDGNQFLIDDPMYVCASDENEEDLDKRFQLSEEQYSNRKGTLKEYLKRNKLGKYDPAMADKREEESRKEKEEREEAMKKDEEMMERIKVGDRCEVTIPKQLPKRGVVAFKGSVQFSEGLWIGVKYDEPFGKNNGSVNGVKYFEAPPNYGAFVRPAYVKVGDYPEITCGLEYDDEF